MKEWGIQIASEKKLRKRAAELIDNDLIGETAMFFFSLKSGGEEMKSSPIVYIPHLKNKIIDLLEKNDKLYIL